MELIRLENVKKIYKTGEVITKAVDGIDFTVNKGEFALIIGASGAGKTTVLNILGGMDTATSGAVFVDGKDISKWNKKQLTGYRRDDIGFVFQFYNLVQNLTALENVELASQICRDPLDAATAVREVGLEDRMDNFPSQLSGGEQQRISIARAMLKDAPVILMDEATASLDPENEVEVQKAIDSLIKGRTVIAIDHRLKTIKDADRIIVLDNGRIKEEGTHDELIRKEGLYAHLWNIQESISGWKL